MVGEILLRGRRGKSHLIMGGGGREAIWSDLIRGDATAIILSGFHVMLTIKLVSIAN